ncbi:MAG: GNAT family N-acetyltransferase [Gammaproteobacteria bacterium]
MAKNNHLFDIRLLQSSDLQIWKTIRLEAVKAYPEAFGSSYEEESLYTEDDFKRGLTESDIFGVFSKNDLIGTVGFFKLKPLKMQHRGTMFGMYIKPEHRGHGAAAQLIQAIISHARQNVLQLHCRVVSENEIAIKFYQKYGFQIYGTEPRALKVDEKFHDEHLMVLKFN